MFAAAASALLPAAEIADIKFEQEGAGKFSPAQLYFNMRLRPGSEYDTGILNEDIKRLYATGDFADISANTEPQADGRVVLVFRIKLQPRISRIVFEGNAKLKTEDLEKLLTIAEDSPLNNAGLRESLNAVRKEYQDKGYNDAAVVPSVKLLPGGDAELTIRITENLRLRVDNVTFEGNTLYSARELKNAIANRYSMLSGLPWIGRHINAGLLNRDELQLDKSRIRELYWNKGFLDFKVEKTELAPDEEDPELVNIKFVIFEGEPYKVGKVSVTSSGNVPAAELEPLLRLKSGEIFDNRLEKETSNAISAYCESLGYADAAVRAVRHADYPSHTVDIDFAVSEGRKYSVRDVVISGNIHTKDKVIRRELVLQPGDPVDNNRIEASKSRLMGMGYFKKVEAVTANADSVDEKDIHIKVEEKDDRFNAKIGAGFSDVNSLVGMAEISSSNFDIADPGNWFYGGGQRMRIQGLFGIERMGFNVDFTEPWLFDRRLRLDVSFYGNQSDFENWSERRYGGRLSLARNIFDDFTTITGAYKFENVNVFDMDRHLAWDTREQAGREWVSQFSLMLDRDTRDSLLMPASGYNLNFLSAISPEIFGSSESFYRLELKGSYYHSFFDKAIIAMAGLRMGIVSNFDRNKQAPIYERYFLGGGDSIRGFSYRDVSPLDSRGNPVGGDTMLLGTVEISHPIWSFIRGAVFVDAGNVWRYSYNFRFSDINVGVGYGLRIQMPVINAPIKLDLAYPIVNKQDNESSKLRFHFNMGFTW